MSKTKSETKPVAAALDLSSPEPVLFYIGEGPIVGDAPARDLTTADLEYLCRVAALRGSGGQPVEPVSSDQIAALVAQLVKTGAFSPDAPPAPAEPVVED